MLRRIVGWTFIGVGFWLFFPIPGPDDILNMVLGGIISETFAIELELAILSTYLIIGPILIYIGCVILPGNTTRRFNMILGKVKTLVIRIASDPKLLAIAIVVFVILYYVYVIFISEAIINFYTTV